METRAFAPLYVSTVPGSGGGATTYGGLVSPATASASTTAAAVVLPGTLNNAFCQIQIANQTTGWAYVTFGVAGQVAVATATNGIPIQPNWAVTVSVPSEVSGASVLLSTGTGSVTFTRGEGVS